MYKNNKKLVVESLFIKEVLKQELSLQEFLLLLYFDNSYDLIFDIELISSVINMSKEDILHAYGSLMKKKIISVSAIKDDSDKIVEKVNIDNFYKEMVINEKKEQETDKANDIFTCFENAFGRTLSNMDYEIINAWIEKGFSEELIKEALNEATYNGVLSLRYVDKVLYDWNRKGFKNVNDIKMREYPEAELFETSIMEFDWLHEK